jgi:hypothetical protein
MNYPAHDTNWTTSSKGNDWKRINGVVLIVGHNKVSGKYWARKGDAFMKGSFETKQSAMNALENNTENFNTCEVNDE